MRHRPRSNRLSLPYFGYDPRRRRRHRRCGRQQHFFFLLLQHATTKSHTRTPIVLVFTSRACPGRMRQPFTTAEKHLTIASARQPTVGKRVRPLLDCFVDKKRGLCVCVRLGRSLRSERGDLCVNRNEMIDDDRRQQWGKGTFDVHFFIMPKNKVRGLDGFLYFAD